MYVPNVGPNRPKWLGKCPSCGEWNSYTEEVVSAKPAASQRVAYSNETARTQPQRLDEISVSREERIDLHDGELNRVLGGGPCPRLHGADWGRTPALENRHSYCRPYWVCRERRYSMYRVKRVPGS